MAWQPEFEPNLLTNVGGVQPVVSRGDRLPFVISVQSDKGIEELTFLINPNQLSFSLEFRANMMATRAGWKVEHAGPALDRMSVTGRSAVFMFQDGIEGPGVCPVDGLATAINREYIQHETEARRQIDHLIRMYRDNGSVRNNRFPFVIDSVGLVAIYYDDVTYLGRFDSLEITEDGTRPFTVDFSFEFTVHERIEPIPYDGTLETAPLDSEPAPSITSRNDFSQPGDFNRFLEDLDNP